MSKNRRFNIKDFEQKELNDLKRIKIVDSMNSWVGSWSFLFFHAVWFILWLVFHWDINMLTMVVSLEAIILMILLLMAQNRQSLKDDLRDEADYRADINSLDTAQKILNEVKEIKKELASLKK